jgi:hypothetical protein
MRDRCDHRVIVCDHFASHQAPTHEKQEHARTLRSSKSTRLPASSGATTSTLTTTTTTTTTSSLPAVMTVSSSSPADSILNALYAALPSKRLSRGYPESVLSTSASLPPSSQRALQARASPSQSLATSPQRAFVARLDLPMSDAITSTSSANAPDPSPSVSLGGSPLVSPASTASSASPARVLDVASTTVTSTTSAAIAVPQRREITSDDAISTSAPSVLLASQLMAQNRARHDDAPVRDVCSHMRALH